MSNATHSTFLPGVHSEKPVKWYCLNQNGKMEYVGLFSSFEEADSSLEFSCVWLVDEELAREWLRDLKGLLEN